MAVPRKRKSNSRRKNQRSHDALRRPTLSKCANCDSPKLPHRVCKSCGFYNGTEVVAPDAD